MNEFILVAMNRKNHTYEELEANRDAAYDAYAADAYDAADAAADAAAAAAYADDAAAAYDDADDADAYAAELWRCSNHKDL